VGDGKRGAPETLFEIMSLSRAGPRITQIAELALTYPGYSLHRATLPVSTWLLAREAADQPPPPGSGPRVVTLEVTDRCNLRCKMCWFWGEKGQGDAFRQRELPDAAYARLIEELAEWRPWIVITGGEPMLRPSAVLEIAQQAKTNAIPVSIINNGTADGSGVLADQIAPLIASITFSVDGPPKVHDFIRGKGAYERTRASIRRVLDGRATHRSPLVGLNFTLTPWNHQHALEMIRLAEDAGVDRLTFQHLWFTSPQQAAEQRVLLKERLGVELSSINGHVISHDFGDVTALVDTLSLIEVEASRSTVQVSTYPRFSPSQASRYYSEDGYTPRTRCLSPWLSTVIKPNGDVVFCPDLWITEYALGNVRESSFADIWKSSRAESFRALLWERRLFPACNRCCALYGY